MSIIPSFLYTALSPKPPGKAGVFYHRWRGHHHNGKLGLFAILLTWMLVYGLVEGILGNRGTSIMKCAWHATMSSPSLMWLWQLHRLPGPHASHAPGLANRRGRKMVQGNQHPGEHDRGKRARFAGKPQSAPSMAEYPCFTWGRGVVCRNGWWLSWSIDQRRCRPAPGTCQPVPLSVADTHRAMSALCSALCWVELA